MCLMTAQQSLCIISRKVTPRIGKKNISVLWNIDQVLLPVSLQHLTKDRFRDQNIVEIDT